jgi:seryl-tRNA synthetase
MSLREPESFLAELVACGLFIPSGVDGVYGRSHAFEQVLEAVDALVVRETAPDQAEIVRFPPLLPRTTLERTGYMTSFPHLAGSIFSFEGSESEAGELGERAKRHEDWSGFLAAADLMLLPASCYPVYPWVAAAGPLPSEGRLVDVKSYCFRHEPSRDPTRLQMFRLHENVRIGSPEQASGWCRSWASRGSALLASIGLETETVPASDPFFGRVGQMLSTNQLEQGLKLELVYPIAGERPTAIMSLNYHQDHFGHDFGIVTASGELAHSACFGVGLDRVTLALLATHGLEPAGWPTSVRERLELDTPAPRPG